MTPARTQLSLDEARLDGWFERIQETSASFEQLARVMGVEYVAFAVIAGVRVTALTIDRARPQNTTVEFQLRDSTNTHELPLRDLKRRLCGALLDEDPPAEGEPGPGAKAIDLQQFIGPKYMLLASFFGIELLTLSVGGGDGPTVRLRAGTIEEEVRLDLFREIIRARIRQELAALETTGGFVLDLGVIEAAEAAAAEGNHAEVLRLMGHWPAQLAMVLRSRDGAEMPAVSKARLSLALMTLARAQEHRGDAATADDTLRLAVQFAQDTPAASAVFFGFGRVQAARGQHGQAIGYLRRALALGEAPASVLPVLAECFAARGRHVAAAVCAEDAVRAGANEASVESTRAFAEGKLGSAWRDLRAEGSPGAREGA